MTTGVLTVLLYKRDWSMSPCFVYGWVCLWFAVLKWWKRNCVTPCTTALQLTQILVQLDPMMTDMPAADDCCIIDELLPLQLHRFRNFKHAHSETSPSLFRNKLSHRSVWRREIVAIKYLFDIVASFVPVINFLIICTSMIWVINSCCHGFCHGDESFLCVCPWTVLLLVVLLLLLLLLSM